MIEGLKPGNIIPSGPFKGLRYRWYAAVEIDPPWDFKSRSAKNQNRLASLHYPIMSLQDIMDIPVHDLLAKNAVAFIWVTDTHLEQVFSVIKAWRLKYKTVGFYWTKDNRISPGKFKGMGFWARANPEQCLYTYDDTDNQMLLATQGEPKRLSKNVAKLIEAPRREHSRKPDEGRESIEALVDGPYLSLFSRESRKGWTTWGNEKSKFDPKVDAGRNSGRFTREERQALL